MDHGYGPDFVYHYFVGTVVHYFAGLSTERYLEYPLQLVALKHVEAILDHDSPVFRLCNREYMSNFGAALEQLGVTIKTGVNCVVTGRSNVGVELKVPDDALSIYAHHLVLAVPPSVGLKVRAAFQNYVLRYMSRDCLLTRLPVRVAGARQQHIDG